MRNVTGNWNCKGLTLKFCATFGDWGENDFKSGWRGPSKILNDAESFRGPLMSLTGAMLENLSSITQVVSIKY